MLPGLPGYRRKAKEPCLANARRYNAMSHPVPFMKASNVTTTKKVAKAQPDLEEAIEEEDDAGADAVEVEADEDELDLKKDKYIKQPKAKAKRAPKKASKGDEDGSEDAAPKATKGRGKAAAKGKGKKYRTGGWAIIVARR